ncbi:hypothetical protein DFH08DRAFT_786255 [Mycena albidolilacea]|uniref:Cysteine-rich protein n=1 Tax=Mycena albidolilacea TaxID=1033008 RepID=A0AAD6ZNA0_9AGAR|nr:hypothetical protein DFH08DRAFT_786255 [Mycena albidolilacea]
MRVFKTIAVPLLALSGITLVQAGLIAYAICQTAGCNTFAVACYAGAGLTFGMVVAVAEAPAAAIPCNSALGICSANCAAVALVAPTP